MKLFTYSKNRQLVKDNLELVEMAASRDTFKKLFLLDPAGDCTDKLDGPVDSSNRKMLDTMYKAFHECSIGTEQQSEDTEVVRRTLTHVLSGAEVVIEEFTYTQPPSFQVMASSPAIMCLDNQT